MWWFNEYYSTYDSKRFIPAGLTEKNTVKFEEYKRQFWNADNEYRESVYTPKFGDLNEDHRMFAFLFCSALNFETIAGDIKPLYRPMKPYKLFKHICREYMPKLNNKTDNRTRIRNIQSVNSQRPFKYPLRKKVSYEIPYSKPFVFNKPWKGPRRSLVLNFKKGEIDYFEFGAICYTLNKYIRDHHSTLFNDVRVVSTPVYEYPYFVHRLCHGHPSKTKVSYKAREGAHLLEECFIGGDLLPYTTEPGRSLSQVLHKVIMDTTELEDHLLNHPASTPTY